MLVDEKEVSILLFSDEALFSADGEIFEDPPAQ